MQLEEKIIQLYDNIANPDFKFSNEDEKSITDAISLLDSGETRVCSQNADGSWTTHQWLKKSILLYFKLMKMTTIKSGDLSFFDKIPLKQWTGKEGVRVVPHALARVGSFIEAGAIQCQAI